MKFLDISPGLAVEVETPPAILAVLMGEFTVENLRNTITGKLKENHLLINNL